MMTVGVSDSTLDITFEGWDRLWCAKRRLSIPLAHVKSVSVQPPPPMNWKHLRAPGTSWPGKIRAGSYWSWEAHEWSFWNVRRANRVLVIDLEGEKYSRLVLEVPDPEEVKNQIQAARLGRTR